MPTEFSVSSYYDHLSQKMGEVDHASVDSAIALIKTAWSEKKKTLFVEMAAAL